MLLVATADAFWVFSIEAAPPAVQDHFIDPPPFVTAVVLLAPPWTLRPTGDGRVKNSRSFLATYYVHHSQWGATPRKKLQVQYCSTTTRTNSFSRRATSFAPRGLASSWWGKIGLASCGWCQTHAVILEGLGHCLQRAA